MKILKLGYFFLILVLLGVASAQQNSAAPHIDKIEPPNWWVGLPSPMLMVAGEHLEGARASIHAPAVRITRTMDGLDGRYFFIWLDIAGKVPPGKIRIDVATSQGHQPIELPLERRNIAGVQSDNNAGFDGFGVDDVIYLIMPDRFDDGDPGNNFPDSGTYDRNSPRAYHGGDLRGIQQRLPYLKDLGVTTIWITPIYNNDDHTGRSYHGYGATDLYAMEEHFGTLAAYQSLVKAAHGQGMKVLLDIVPNHIGPTNPWVDHPPTLKWLHGTRENHLAERSPFQVLTDPHSLDRQRRNVLEGWFANSLPDMGTDDPVTAQYLRQNAIWWAEEGSLDGFRIDTFPYVDRGFWRQFHAELHQTYPRFRTVGEVFSFDPAVISYFVGGKTADGIDTGLDTVFDFPFYSTVRKVILQNEPAKELEDLLRHDWLYPHPENLVTLIGNHDTKRFMGETGATAKKLELAFSLLLTMRGVPEIYYGDEIAMSGAQDPDNRRDFPGGFPGDEQNAFTAQGRTPEEQEVFLHVHDLLHLRMQHPALRKGQLSQLFSDDKAYAYVRDFSGNAKAAAERLLMVMNNADEPRTVEFEIQETPLAAAKSFTPLTGGESPELTQGAYIKVVIPPRSLNIYSVAL